MECRRESGELWQKAQHDPFFPSARVFGIDADFGMGLPSMTPYIPIM
jgi:hypothetical protein